MILEALGLLLATGLLVVLPGFLLSYALFPRKEQLTTSERVYLTFAGGMLVLMSIAIVLGFLPHGSRGHLQSLATGGMPNVEIASIAADLGLTWIAMRRGAFASLAAKLPTSWRARATPRPPEPGQ